MSEGGRPEPPPAPRGPAGPPRVWHLIRFSDYRRLWISALAMIIAQQLRFVALPAWLLIETGREEVVGIVGAVQLPVQIVSVLWGGVLADRFDRRWLMAGCNAFVLAMLIALAAARNGRSAGGLDRLRRDRGAGGDAGDGRPRRGPRSLRAWCPAAT